MHKFQPFLQRMFNNSCSHPLLFHHVVSFSEGFPGSGLNVAVKTSNTVH